MRREQRSVSEPSHAPPLPDPFATPTKSARDLLRFDAQASAFRPVKVRAQVLFSEAQDLFAVDEGTGLRVLAAEAATLRPGDLIEAVGYPEIGGPSPLLRQALVRKTGTGRLPEPTVLEGPDLALKGLDSTRVRLEGRLMDIHLPGESGIVCTARLRMKAPTVQVIMLTVYKDTKMIFQALKAGACGYVLKLSSPNSNSPDLLFCKQNRTQTGNGNRKQSSL